MKPLNVVVCGVGGYGREVYVEALLKRGKEYGLNWVGAVEPYPDSVPDKEAIDAIGVPWFTTLEEFYENNTADLCIVAAPIQFHAPLSILAMQHGSHVLCEKPICALPSESKAMREARDEAGVLLSIGYQWSHSAAIRRMKQDIADGVYGKPLDLQCVLHWPRDHAYFKRGIGWAGKKHDRAGRWVLDSVANNATAHYLHNMLFVLGGRENAAAMPEALRATLCRTNPIEMYDTAIMEAEMGADCAGAKVRFMTTHASYAYSDVICDYRFEKGVIVYGGADGREFTGRLNDGRVITYGNALGDEAQKMFEMADAIRDAARVLPCVAETAEPHNRCMIAALLSTDIIDTPKEMVEDVNGERLAVKEIDAIFEVCARERRLPGASEAAWAAPGKRVRLDDAAIDAYGEDA